MSQQERTAWLLAAWLAAVALFLRLVPGIISDHGCYVIRLALVQENAAFLAAVIALLFMVRALELRNH